MWNATNGHNVYMNNWNIYKYFRFIPFIFLITFYHGCQKYTHKIVMDYNCKAKKDWKLTRLKSTLSSSNQFINRHSRNLRNNHEDIRLKLPHKMTCLFLLSSVHYQKLSNCTFTHPKWKELWINKLKEIWKY